MVTIAPTVPWTPEACKIELSTDPLKIGYAALLVAGDETNIPLAEALNLVRDGEPYAVPRGVISRSMFIGECLQLGVVDNLMALPDATIKSGWIFLLQYIMPLIDEFDVNSKTFSDRLVMMLTTGLLDQVGADALQYRQGSRAEVLWGAGIHINPAMVGEVTGL